MIPQNNQANLQNINHQARISNAYFIRGGRESAMNYPVAAGYEAFLVDEENKMFYVKTNDMAGRSISLREFKYEEVTPVTNTAQGTPFDFDPSKYVTKDDFNVLVDEIRKLQKGRDREHQFNNRNNRRSRNGKSYDNE